MKESPDAPSDAQLIDAYLTGHQAAFTALYMRHKNALLSVINPYVKPNYAAADDIAQQSWIAIIKDLSNYQDQGIFAVWACRIARNTAINYLRRSKNDVSLNAYDESLQERVPDESDTSWTDYDSPDLEAHIREAIATLKPYQQEVLMLREEGVPYNQIAEIQNVSLSTALGRYHDAVALIRKKIAHLKEL